MNKIKFKVTKEKTGFSATAKYHEHHFFAQGKTPKELKENVLGAVHVVYPETSKKQINQNIELMHSIKTIFEFLPIKKKLLAERIEMNPLLLIQYTKGTKKPSKKQIERIKSGLVDLGKELNHIHIS